MDAAAIIGLVGAVAACLTLVYVVRSGRPSPSAWFSADPATGNLGPNPAIVHTLQVTNNGAAPLRVRVALLLHGKPVGGSLDGPSTLRKTIAVAQTNTWSLGVEEATLASADHAALKARVSFRWLFVRRSMTLGLGDRVNY